MPTILIIEDNQLVSELLRLTLVDAGYAVLCAADGESGVTTARISAPDAVVLDLRLPGREGEKVLQDLKAFAPSTPVFVHSSYCDLADRAAGLLQADGCFVKSGDLGPLVRAIKRSVSLRT